MKKTNLKTKSTLITFHIINFNEELKNQILTRINQIIQEKYPNVEIIFDSSKQYWKFPEETQCFFFVIANENFQVKQIIDLLTDVEWEYRLINKNEERSVWSKLIKNDVLINKNITWAHIATWSE